MYKNYSNSHFAGQEVISYRHNHSKRNLQLLYAVDQGKKSTAMDSTRTRQEFNFEFSFRMAQTSGPPSHPFN